MSFPIEPANTFKDILRDSHWRMLKVESGISPEVIEQRGYRTVTESAELAALGFPSKQAKLVPCLLIPIHSPCGEIVNYQIRPDAPRINSETGKARKYEFATGSLMRLDVPPKARKDIDDPKVPLWVTEGCRKADSAVSRGLCCIALGGVWNWRGTNSKGGKVVLPDFEAIALNDRSVYIAFDSDIADKPNVRDAFDRLAGFLQSRKAKVFEVRFP